MSWHAMEYSLMNSFKTGNMLMDMCICMCIPILLNVLFTSLKSWNGIARLKHWFEAFRLRRQNIVLRNIELIQRINNWGIIEDATQTNGILQKAIASYLQHHTPKLYPKASLELVYQNHQQFQQQLYQKMKQSVKQNPQDESIRLEAHPYENYQFTLLPPPNEWIVLSPILYFRYTIEDMGEKQGSSTPTASNSKDQASGLQERKITYSIQHRRTTASLQEQSQAIQAFLDNAMQLYIDLLKEQEIQDQSRYLYLRWKHSMQHYYKQYLLSEEKTFNSLFFQDKTKVLGLLDNFMNKTGKFQVKGFPYKLGFLLHGPPGTGKTSLIKAIAQYSKRHIVSISLSQIQTNQQLIEILYECHYKLQNATVQLKQRDVVFVMEDIDCVNDIVHKRTENSSHGLNEQSTLCSNCDALLDHSDALNLAGLLNALDGVVDANHRILIMTTNHPEKLDPALIRPGRINLQVHLGKMHIEQLKQMLEHYYNSELSISQYSLLKQFDQMYTPAYIEQLCTEFDTIDELITACRKSEKI